MKRMVFWTSLIIFCLSAGIFEALLAAGKPNVTRHEARFLEDSVNMHIEWQSPNPVTSVKVSMPGVAKEIAVDPYDNRRNPDGYSGEVDVNLNIGGMIGQSFNYVVQLQDELRIKSEPVTGQVKVPVPQQPGAVYPGAVAPGVVITPFPSGPTQQIPDGHGGGLSGQPAPWPGPTAQQPGVGTMAPGGMPSQTQMPGSQPSTQPTGGLGR